MKTHGGMTGKWLIWILTVGWVLGICTNLQEVSADPIDECVEGEYVCFPIGIHDLPGVDAVIELDELVFELGETIEGTFTVTNNHDEIITGTAYYSWDRVVRILDSNGNEVFTTDQGGTLGIIEPYYVSIAPGESWVVSFSWNQIDLPPYTEQVDPGEYTIKGYTPFYDGYSEVAITIIPEPMTGLLVIVLACGLAGGRSLR